MRAFEHRRGAAARGTVIARVVRLGLLAIPLLVMPCRAQVLAMVSPTQATIGVRPGETVERDVTVSNLGAVPVRVRVRLSDWTLSDDGGIGLAALGSTAGTLEGSLSWSPAEFPLAPGESGRVRIKAGLGAAGHATRWGMLLCEVRSTARTATEIGSRAATELGTTLFVTRIPPDQVHASITGLVARALGGDSVAITARVRNTGLRHLVVTGNAALAGPGGARLGGGAFASGLILPGAFRTFEWVGTATRVAGSCLASATFDSGEPELLEGETGFAWPGSPPPAAGQTTAR